MHEKGDDLDEKMDSFTGCWCCLDDEHDDLRGRCPSSALVAGGIEYGASADYVQQVYGTPTEVETKHHSLWNGEVTEYEYGDSFELKFVDGYVRHIEISRHNGIKTAAGIEVGSTLDAVKAAYGEPDKIRGDKYIYYCDEDRSIGLVFEIENNKVDEIEMGYLD